MRLGATIVTSVLVATASCSSVDSYLPDGPAAGTVPTTSAPTTEPTVTSPDTTSTTAASTIAPTVDPTPDPANPVPFSAVDLRGPIGIDVIETLPHDPTAFTQGLEVASGALVESTGLYGASTRRLIDPGTGEAVLTVPLDGSRFGTGLTVLGDTVVQLTWRAGVAELAALDSLEPVAEREFAGEGWGICAADDRFVTSNGTDRLVIRDASTFEEIDAVTVTLDGRPVTRIAELECVADLVWATVWLTADLILIDPESGVVVATADASSLVPSGLGRDDVLSAIAHDPSSDTYFVTGKRWDVLYRISFTTS